MKWWSEADGIRVNARRGILRSSTGWGRYSCQPGSVTLKREGLQLVRYRVYYSVSRICDPLCDP